MDNTLKRKRKANALKTFGKIPCEIIYSRPIITA